ncbi:MAG: hypothetical protein NTZ05_13615 [Chloroflexi bacterium]|nr:hypothetical protein [Chloroflexota bacterium]
MNILDENIEKKQRLTLQGLGVHARQVGIDFGRLGLKDYEILPLLQRLSRPTFFTCDADFYKRDFCHQRYCLVFFDIDADEVASFVRRFLRHPDYRTQAQRMGKVFWVTDTGIRFWRLHGEAEEHAVWSH